MQQSRISPFITDEPSRSSSSRTNSLNSKDAIFEGTVYRPAIIIANKADIPNAAKKLNN